MSARTIAAPARRNTLDFGRVASKIRSGVGSGRVARGRKSAARGTIVNENGNDDEPRPRGALILITIYLAVLAAFWLNTYLRIWRS